MRLHNSDCKDPFSFVLFNMQIQNMMYENTLEKTSRSLIELTFVQILYSQWYYNSKCIHRALYVVMYVQLLNMEPLETAQTSHKSSFYFHTLHICLLCFLKGAMNCKNTWSLNSVCFFIIVLCVSQYTERFLSRSVNCDRTFHQYSKALPPVL